MLFAVLVDAVVVPSGFAHRERACHPLVGSTDGVQSLRSLLASAHASAV